MQIIPAAGPNVQPIAGASSAPQMTARDRAIAALTAPNGNQQAVPNASNVSPEEMSAVKTPSVQKDSVDAPAAEVTEAPSEPISSQYAALARREKAIRARAQADAQKLNAERAALQAEREAMKAKEAEYSSKYIPKDRLQNDLVNTLAEAGLSYDQITNLMLNQQQSTPQDSQLMSEIRALKAELASVKTATEETKKSYADGQTQQYEQAKSMIKQEINSLIRTNPEFETIKETNSSGDVLDLIERTLREDGIMLSTEEAAMEVEKELSERLYNYSSKISKVRNRLQAKQATAAPTAEKQPETKQSQMKTLTNNVSTSRQLSARERALLAFKGELK